MPELPPPIDPADIPFVPPQSVSLVNGEGRPRAALTDWFHAVVAWFSRTTVDLQRRITLVSDAADGNSAAIAEERTARVTADGALAQSLDTLSADFQGNSARVEDRLVALAQADGAMAGRIATVAASAGAATAEGQLFWTAMAGPAGATSAFGLFLAAGGAWTGISAVADAAGGSYIGFAADRFRFTDTGTGVDVFSWNGSYWNFNADVRIRNADLLANAVTNSAVAIGSPFAEVSLRLRTGSRVLIIGSYDGGGTLAPNPGALYDIRLRDGRTGAVLKRVAMNVVPSGSVGSGAASYLSTPIIHGLTIEGPEDDYVFRIDCVLTTGFIDVAAKVFTLCIIELSR